MSYRASLSTGTRSGGQSASAKHKYQNRQEIYLVGREGVRDDLAASGSGNLPAFADGDAGKFWLAVDSFERKNARLFVELQLNLPAELSLEQQKEAVKNYMSELCDKENLTYSWVIHHPENGENQHAHVMINEQKNDSIDRPAEQHFMRWNSKHPERGGAQKSSTLKPKQWLMDARAGWAIAANDGLEAAGFERHFDHRSLEDQRTAALLGREWRRAAELDREVCEHEGPRVAGLRRRFELGLIDRLPDYAKTVIESNNNISAINAAHLEMVAGMSDAELGLMEREAYFEALAEHEPERLTAELQQLHSEAIELDAQTKITEQKIEPDFRAQPSAAASTSANAGSVREHVQRLFVVQARRNNQVLQANNAERSVENFIDKRNPLRSPVQSAGRASRDELLDVRGRDGGTDRVEPLALVEPQPEPLAAQPQPEPEPLAVAVLQEPEPQPEAESLDNLMSRWQSATSTVEGMGRERQYLERRIENIKSEYQQIKSAIEQAPPPNFVERFFVKIGLIADRFEPLERRIKSLRDEFGQAKQRMADVVEFAAERRATAEALDARIQKIKQQQPKPKPESEAKQPQPQPTALDGFFNSTGYRTAAAEPEPSRSQQTVRRPSRGPRMG